ncbi:tyrosine-type recombinase/integrase [Streptosporangium sp. NPDC002721]|uniref:tyrosine-type recombinase/integrase n=1 Tax=Streptosporangium sp. NPDC002721 TaxID=3366188 RepID=UPI0036C162B3
MEPRNVNRSWDTLCKRTQIGRLVRIHDLRHACGSFLFAEGTDIKTIQGVLRHTRQAITSDSYVHLLEEVKRGAAESMAGPLSDLTTRRTKQGKEAS